MRFEIALLVALTGAAVTGAVTATANEKPNAAGTARHSVVIRSRSIRDFSKSDRRRGNVFGALRFVGGLVLSSSDEAFGGFSGLEMSADGERIFAVSDAGAWLTAKLMYDGGRPTGFTDASIGPIRALSDKQLVRARDRDAEAARLISGDLTAGDVLIGFERNQRIGFFKLRDGDLEAPTRYLRPPRGLSPNKGIEAVGVVPKGPSRHAVVAFAERSLDANGHHRGWLWPAIQPNKRADQARRGIRYDETPRPIALTNVGGFDVTDVAATPDGSVYVLERRFRWSEGVFMRIRRLEAATIKPGAVLTGETLLEADLGFEIDNMEGIATHRAKSGRTVLTLISDNNFNSFLQRTLLLQFEVIRDD